MCDAIECMEQMMTVLNLGVPKVLAVSDHYVVKGGRAIDYHIMKKNGIRLLRLTDWDIAVDSMEAQTTLSNAIVKVLKTTYNIDTTQTKIDFKGLKGVQINILCGDKGCPFMDIIQYDPDKPIFNNTVVDENIRYISYEYTMTDLDETYKDRVSNLDSYLDNIGIDIRSKYITSRNADQMTDRVRNFMIKQLTDKYEQDKTAIDEMLTDEDYQISPEDHKEEMDQLYNRFIRDISFTARRTGKMTERFKKLARTKERRNILKEAASMMAQDHRGGRRTRKVKRR